MIEAYPTKHGTGVEFRGTYNDFGSLYDTMTKLAMTNIEMLSDCLLYTSDAADD